jgi:hypothetical protein
MLLKLWHDVVVYHLEINLSSDISFKEKWTNYLAAATKPNPNRQFFSTDVDLIVELRWLSCDCILSNVVGVYLAVHGKCSFISSNEWAKEILVSLVMVTQPSRKLHSPSIVSRKELVSDVHAVRVHV